MKELHIPLDLILRAQQGDQQAIEQVIYRSRFLIQKFAKHYSKRTVDCLEDLRQVGSIGIWRALQDYDSSRSSFLTHSYNWVQAKVGREAYYNSKKRIHPTYSDLTKEGEEFFQSRRTSKPREVGNDIEKVKKAFDLLDERTKHIITHRYGLHGFPQKTTIELGKELKVTSGRITQLEREGLQQIKYIIEFGKVPEKRDNFLKKTSLETRKQRKEDLLPLVLSYHQQGHSRVAIAAKTGLSRRTINKWLKQV